MPTIGKIIEQRRNARGWERARLAREANVDARSLYNIETGRTDGMRSELFERVAKALDTTADAIREEAETGLVAVKLPGVLVEQMNARAHLAQLELAAWLQAMIDAGVDRRVKRAPKGADQMKLLVKKSGEPSEEVQDDSGASMSH